jgi:hypothetical protein
LKSHCFFGEFKVNEGEKLSKQNNNNRSLELFDWMLAIDFDPAECKIDRNTADSIAKILFA